MYLIIEMHTYDNLEPDYFVKAQDTDHTKANDKLKALETLNETPKVTYHIFRSI